MAPQRYEPIASDEPPTFVTTDPPVPTIETNPSSPPPSFRSRASSLASRRRSRDDLLPQTEAERELAASFEPDSESEDENDERDSRRRLVRSTTNNTTPSAAPRPSDNSQNVGLTPAPGRPSALSALTTATGIGGLLNWSRARTNDGVFANVQASADASKPEEHLPTYEQAAADAAPQYWETTILAPGVSSDTVFVEGLPVGTVFSFIWNGLISVSFQFIGFLLTYLLHTTHAAKNGSRAGLGITLIQYGFYMKSSAIRAQKAAASNMKIVTADLNDPNIDPAGAQVAYAISGSMEQSKHITRISGTEWFAYLLMIVGWFVLIKSISNYLRMRRAEQLILSSPERGLSQPIVATGEGENAV